MFAFVFPGQGSQKVGMGKSWFDDFAVAREIFERAGEVLDFDLAAICFDGPPETLTDTRFAQPALLTTSVIAWHIALERGLKAQMAAGHSVGEYAALVAAGALEFEEALRLVQQRAQLMAQAPTGTMAALIGLADEQLESVLSEASKSGLVVGANFNSPGQVVVSGEESAVAMAMSEAKKAGAKMAVALPVSGAFHSPLMRAAGREMAQLIEAAPFRDAEIPVYQNTSARPAQTADELKAALRAQMTGPVRWSESVRAMIADGATEFYELGAGKVLCGLIGRIDKSVSSQNSENWTV
jgi:[acyl-carrier-protein] S-malonyltransferase